jgi:3-oxoacyl-[acyl-carrier protein] reductase
MASGNKTLEGKVAIVTGGGTGIGKTMALALAEEGADIVAAARRAGAIEQTVREVQDLGRRGLAIPTDVTDSKQVDSMVEQTLKEMGRLDILINNAGIVRGQERKPIWDVTDEEWRLGIYTNLSGAFFCCRATSRHFVEQKRGKIINVASGNGLRGARNDFMYGSAKAGVINLTRVLATTFAQDNIQVNCIAPGFIDVRAIQPEPLTRPMTGGAQFIPMGRLGRAEDIAYLGLFLASDASDYITGALFCNDGGGLAGGFAPTGYIPLINLEED